MFRWLTICLILCGAAYFFVVYGVDELKKHGYVSEDTFSVGDPTPRTNEPTRPNFASDPVEVIMGSNAGGRVQTAYAVPDARILPIDRTEVPSERDGTLLLIGTEVAPGEVVAKDKKLTAPLYFLVIEVGPGEQVPMEEMFNIPGDLKKRRYRRWMPNDPLKPEALEVVQLPRDFRRLDVGEEVKAGQMVALVDPLLAVRELQIKIAQVNAAESERRASGKTYEEAERRYETRQKQQARAPGTVSLDEINEARLTSNKYREEEIAKAAAVYKAQQELMQAITILRKHEVRSAIDGAINVMYKNRGDAVKNLDSILQVQSSKRLRVEGLAEVQDVRHRIKLGDLVLIEPSIPEAPREVLRGHLLDVTCVAVSQGPESTIVSGSDDRTLRGWKQREGRQFWQISYRSAFRSVACTPPGAASNLAMAGCADGTTWLVDIKSCMDADKMTEEEKLTNPDKARVTPRELKNRHSGAVTCVTFSPDGALCATGSEDRSICLWDVASGERLHRLSYHRAAVTSLQFVPGDSHMKLISAGRDNTLVVWRIESEKPPVREDEKDSRGGDVQQLSVSPDGKRVLFDQGKELRLLSLAARTRWQIEGVLQNSAGSSNFSTMALFSPDGRTILTNATEGRLQLWRAPNGEQPRAAEVRQFIWSTGASTCGAFAPDSSFLVTGTQDNRVLIWPMPSEEELKKGGLQARVSLAEQKLDNASRQVRVWAELDNPGWLIPGSSATMVFFPQGTK